MVKRPLLGSPAVKLGSYAAVLGLALGGGAVAGATLGPSPSMTGTYAPHPAPSDHESHGG